MAIDLKPVAPADAIAAYEARRGKLTESFSWQDAFEAEHAVQMTVAKSAGFDVMVDLDAAMAKALAEGRTLQQFSKELRPVLEAKGWWGRKLVTDPKTGDEVLAQLGSPRRLKTIFETNMRVSYAAGHWASFERNKAARPFLRYVALLDERTRPAHRARHNLVLAVDDPYWDQWAPPCGWACRCTLQSLSQRDLDRLIADGEKIKREPPQDTVRNFTNRRTGEVVSVPDGIDPGWGYNPGKASFRALQAGERLIAAPPPIAAKFNDVPEWLLKPVGKEFEDWFDQAAAGGPVRPTIVVAGTLSDDVLSGLARLEEKYRIKPETGAITITQSVLRHTLRDIKADRGAGVTPDDLRNLPHHLARSKAVLLDKRNKALIYVFDIDASKKLGKIAILLDFRDKARPPGGKSRTVILNSVRSAGTVETHNLLDQNYYVLLTGIL